MPTPRVRSAVEFSDIVAATLVVGLDPISSDFRTIQAALDNLPPEGGTIFVLEGTYSISTTITMPNKPVRIVGAGARSTIIDAGSNAIAAFTLAFGSSDTPPYTFEDFSIKFNNVVGQVSFKWTNIVGVGRAYCRRLEVGRSGKPEKIFVASTGVGSVDAEDCSLDATSQLIEGPFTITARFVRCTTGFIAITGTLHHVSSIDSLFNISTAFSVRSLNAINTEFNSGGAAGVVITTTGGDGAFQNSLIECEFTNGCGVTVADGEMYCAGCEFFIPAIGSVARYIDIAIGSAFTSRSRIMGCTFGAYTSEAIRIATSNGVVTGNENCRVTEGIAADFNLYGDNTGFEGSTIIGAASVVMDWNTRTVLATPAALTRDDRTILADATAGAITIPLPTAASAKYQIYVFKKTDASANAVTIDPSGAELIDGAATFVISTQFNSVTIQSNGTTWNILSGVGASMDTRAATLVVGPDHANFTTIAAALAALPAAGGVIYVREGTYALAATLTIPDKPVKILGSGRDTTIIDLGANAIPAFTIGFAREYTFEDFSIRGTDLVGQQGFSFNIAAGTARFVDINRVKIGLPVAGSGVPVFVESVFGAAVKPIISAIDGEYYLGSGGGGLGLLLNITEAHFLRVKATGAGLGSSGTEFNATDCDIDTASDVSAVRGCAIVGTLFRSGTLDVLDNARVVGCRFIGNAFVLAGGNVQIVGNSFEGNGGIAPYHVDVTGQNVVVANNRFVAFAGEEVRTVSTGGTYTGNVNCQVLEVAPADSNVYGDNTGFDGSTIIGAASVVMDWNTRTVLATPAALTRDDRTILADATAGAITIPLPTAAAAKYQVYTVKKTDASANAVTIDPSGAELIDGQTTLVLSGQLDSVVFQSDGTAWRILSINLGVSTPLTWRPDPATNPSMVSEDQVYAFELPDGSVKGVVSTMLIPRNQSLLINPILLVPFIVTTTGAGAGNAQMRLTCRYIANGELTSKAADETVLVTQAVVNTDKIMGQISFTLNAALMAANDKLNFHLERVGNVDPPDTFTGNIGVVADASRYNSRG